MKGIIITETKCVRFLTDRQAAEYAGMTLVEFRRFCADEGVTAIERANGRKVYDVHELDATLDQHAPQFNAGHNIDELIATMQ